MDTATIEDDVGTQGIVVENAGTVVNILSGDEVERVVKPKVVEETNNTSTLRLSASNGWVPVKTVGHTSPDSSWSVSLDRVDHHRKILPKPPAGEDVKKRGYFKYNQALGIKEWIPVEIPNKQPNPPTSSSTEPLKLVVEKVENKSDISVTLEDKVIHVLTDGPGSNTLVKGVAMTGLDESVTGTADPDIKISYDVADTPLPSLDNSLIGTEEDGKVLSDVHPLTCFDKSLSGTKENIQATPVEDKKAEETVHNNKTNSDQPVDAFTGESPVETVELEHEITAPVSLNRVDHPQKILPKPPAGEDVKQRGYYRYNQALGTKEWIPVDIPNNEPSPIQEQNTSSKLTVTCVGDANEILDLTDICHGANNTVAMEDTSGGVAGEKRKADIVNEMFLDPSSGEPAEKRLKDEQLFEEEEDIQETLDDIRRLEACEEKPTSQPKKSKKGESSQTQEDEDENEEPEDYVSEEEDPALWSTPEEPSYEGRSEGWKRIVLGGHSPVPDYKAKMFATKRKRLRDLMAWICQQVKDSADFDPLRGRKPGYYGLAPMARGKSNFWKGTYEQDLMVLLVKMPGFPSHDAATFYRLFKGRWRSHFGVNNQVRQTLNKYHSLMF